MKPKCDAQHKSDYNNGAWLCITSMDDLSFHIHVCGMHARPFRVSGSESRHVFRTIDPKVRVPYKWINGFGCTLDH